MSNVDIVFDHMAIHEPVRVPVLVKRTGLASNQVSTSLFHLVSEGVVEKMARTDDPYYSYKKNVRARKTKKLRKKKKETALSLAMDKAVSDKIGVPVVLGEEAGVAMMGKTVLPEGAEIPLNVWEGALEGTNVVFTARLHKVYTMKELDAAIGEMLTAADHLVAVCTGMQTDLKDKTDLIDRIKKMV